MPTLGTADALTVPPQVRGISRKGKEFFRFNTQLTEQIRRVDIFDKNIWTTGEFVSNHFIEGKDESLFVCPDRITDSEVRSHGHDA